MKSCCLHLCLAGLLLCFAASTSAQSYAINWYKVAGGGGTSSGGTFSVSGTIGQPDASATMTGGSFAITGGFWTIIGVFQTTGAPYLTITRSGPNVVVSWPDTGNYTLQQNDSLNPGGWFSTSYNPTQTDGTNSVMFPPTNGQIFFRLKQ